MLSTRRETVYQFCAAACGILSLFALLPSLAFAGVAGMLFDAPGSEQNLDLWPVFYVYFTMPLVFVLAIPLATICFRRLTTRHMLFLISPFIIWVLAAIVVTLITGRALL